LAGHLTSENHIKYVEDDEVLLDQIKPLWEALNRYHLGSSKNFKQYYLDMTFQKRKAELLKKATLGKMRINIALIVASGQNVGYCISSINNERTGEMRCFDAENARLVGQAGCSRKNRRGSCWQQKSIGLLCSLRFFAPKNHA